MCDLLPWTRPALKLAISGGNSDNTSPIRLATTTPSPQKQQQRHSPFCSCCPSPLALPTSMCQKSPLKSHSLAEMFVRLCNCASTSSNCAACSSIATSSSSSSSSSPAKLTRGTPRSALVELKNDSNIQLFVDGSGSAISSGATIHSPTLPIFSQKQPSTSPILGKKQPSSPSPSSLRKLPGSAGGSRTTKSQSGSPSSKVAASTVKGALSKSRSGKRTLGSSDPGDDHHGTISESKENHQSAAAAGELHLQLASMVAAPFKRKRPPKLTIPNDDGNTQTAAAAAAAARRNDVPAEVSAQGRSYGVYSRKGHRETLEDTYQAILDIDGNHRQAFFGIFDGHGGRRAAEYAAAHLAANIAEALNSGECELEAAVRLGYLATDAGFIQKQVTSGASCVTASVLNGSLVVANAGDCRAILCRNGGQAVALTRDHRLEREDERRRVEDLGGYVDCYSGVWRLQGILAVSRGIGDIHLKEWVSAEPEILRVSIDKDCEFLVLASDGLWDVVSNQEAVDCVREELMAKSELRSCSQKLVQLAASKGSMDDISVLIVDLKSF